MQSSDFNSRTWLAVQGSAKEWSPPGCVFPASWLPLVAGARFTQPTDHPLADPCIPDLTKIIDIRSKVN